MASAEHLEYECLRCGIRRVSDNALISTCERCGGDMRNVEKITR